MLEMRLQCHVNTCYMYEVVGDKSWRKSHGLASKSVLLRLTLKTQYVF